MITLIKINVATDEGNSQNEIGHYTKNEIGVAVKSWLCSQSVRTFEGNSVMVGSNPTQVNYLQ